MNLKYYLRGLGIGIVVTAIIMSISANDKTEKLSDAQIKERAAELGMIEPGGSGYLSDLKEAETPKPTEKPKETDAPEVTETPEPVKTPEPTQTPEPVKTPEPTQIPEPTESPETEEITQGSVITIKVNSGESSYTICKRLQENGLIASANDFDSYLCSKGLDKKLRAGSFEIPENSDPDQIAEILTIK